MIHLSFIEILNLSSTYFIIFSVLLVNQYDEKNPDLTQVKIADFGLSRDYASNYMTGTLGTYVILILFSIGWLHKYSIINPTHSKQMYTHMA